MLKLLGVGVLFAVCCGCNSDVLNMDRPAAPPFTVGDLARLRVDDSQVQVLRIQYGRSERGEQNGWMLECRIGTPGRMRQDGVLRRYLAINAYSTQWFHLYELAVIETPPAEEKSP